MQRIGTLMHDVIAQQCEAMGMNQERLAQFLDPSKEPDPEPCPYCHMPLSHHLLVADEPSFGWCPIPDPCTNPECIEKAEEKREQKARRELMDKLHKDIQASGIPKKFWNATTNSFQPRKQHPHVIAAKNAVIGFVNDFDRHLEDGTGMYIQGPQGVGKTHLAVIAARGVLSQGHYVRFVSTADLATQVRDSFSGGDDPLREYRNCSLLVLDDIGQEDPQRWVLSRVYDLVRTRYNAGRPTVYTSSLRFDDLRDHMSADGNANIALAVVSRIAEMSQVVSVIAPAYRAERSSQHE